MQQKKHKIEAIIHFAASAIVPDSVGDPAFTFMRRFGPEAVLPPLVAEHADRVLHWKPQGAEKLALVSDLTLKRLRWM